MLLLNAQRGAARDKESNNERKKEIKKARMEERERGTHANLPLNLPA